VAKKTKSSKSAKPAKDLPEDVTDKIEAAEDAVEELADSAPETDTTVVENDAPAAEPEVEEPPVEEPEPEVVEPAPEPVEMAPEPAPRPVEPHDSASNSVFLPAILGGLIAAGLGFGVAYYLIPRADPDLNTSVAANTSAVEALQGELEAAAAVEPAEVDLSGVTDQIASVQEEVTAGFEDLSGRIGEIDERLITLEKQPSSDGTLQESALQAYQRELDELRGQVEEQASAAFAQLESTRAEAEAIEQAALDAARAAQIRAALAQIQTGLAEGTPMQTALTDLEAALGEPVPAPLADVADGAPTLAKLQADFPNAARSALAAARSGNASGEETSAFGAFLREQLNVRSVAPREGDDADAILSRAQAAVSNGQLQIALDEVASLPEAASGSMTEWVAIAETRVAAVSAADEISLSLNVN